MTDLPGDSERAHVQEQLAALLHGDCDREETIRIARHLRACSICRDDLVSAAVASGSLLAARRTLGHDLVRGDAVEGTGPSPPGSDPSGAGSGAPPAALPPLRLGRFRRAGREARGDAVRKLVQVAAACVLVAAGIGVGSWISRSPTPPRTAVVARAVFRPIAASASSSGQMILKRSGAIRVLVVDTKGLRNPPGNHFYEVWLLDPVTNKMMAMGILAPTGQASFQVPSSLLGGYSAVDISLQANNGNPAHSATSVLRAHF